MSRKLSITILATVFFIISSIILVQPAISSNTTYKYQYYERDRDYYRDYSYYKNDRISSEKRDGKQADDWIERGASSVTDSPKYKNGIRLTTWSNRYNDEYEYGLASAIYYFDIPSRARSIKIKIRYNGEHGRYSADDEIVGRLWIRANSLADRYEEYYPDEKRYKSRNKPLYGDTFNLRKNKNTQEITVSAREHRIDGKMEVHVIAEGGQRIDVDYMEVQTYTSLPEIKVVTREYRNYNRPWYHHTYLYFYSGPVYYFDGDYYIKYIYPRGRSIIEIRREYDGYLERYHRVYPHISLYWSGRLNLPRLNQGRIHVWLDKWTPDYENTRRSYDTFFGKTRKPIEIQRFREEVRSVITRNRKPDSEYYKEDELRRKDRDEYRDDKPGRNIWR